MSSVKTGQQIYIIIIAVIIITVLNKQIVRFSADLLGAMTTNTLNYDMTI